MSAQAQDVSLFPVEVLVAAGACPPIPLLPDELVSRNERRAVINYILTTLAPREERVIKMRFGLDGEEEHTLREIAQYFAVTCERVRQIETKALRKLQHESRARKLKDWGFVDLQKESQALERDMRRRREDSRQRDLSQQKVLVKESLSLSIEQWRKGSTIVNHQQWITFKQWQREISQVTIYQ